VGRRTQQRLSSDAGAYDPVARTWREIPTGPLSGRVEHSAVRTGAEMIVWGGSRAGGRTGFDDGEPITRVLASGPSYPRRRFRHAAIWNGEAMVFWGGQRVGGGGSGSFRDGAIYQP
jgi:hypothetical protein